MRHWLMKSEPQVFSIDHLEREKTSLWDGIRNYQARNFMMKDMKVGDPILFYHSNAQPPGLAGLAQVSQQAQVDPTQFDPKSPYFDAKSQTQKPRWHCVELAFYKKFPNYVPLYEMRQTPELENMLLLKKGQRLSIQPVTKKEFEILCQMGGSKFVPMGL